MVTLLKTLNNAIKFLGHKNEQVALIPIGSTKEDRMACKPKKRGWCILMSVDDGHIYKNNEMIGVYYVPDKLPYHIKVKDLRTTKTWTTVT